LNFSSAGDAGGVEVQNLVDKMIRDAIPRATEFRQLVRRESLASGIVHTWRLNTSFNTSGKFYDEGDANEPDPTNRVQLFNPTKAYRIDYEVSGLLIAGGQFDVLGREAANALSQMALDEELAMVNGSDTSAGGLSGSYPGLLQLMLNNGDHGDTSTIYGITRAGANTAYVEVQAVDAGTSGTATGTLALSDLDAILTKCEKRKLGGRRVYLMSFERADEVNALLQPQQRFVGSTEIAAGLRVLTYRGIPLVRSKRMATNGVTNTGAGDNSTDADNSIYLLDMDEIVFKNVAGVDFTHVPINGVGDSTTATNAGGTSRADAVGGYFKTYGAMSMTRFDNQGIIWNITAP